MMTNNYVNYQFGEPVYTDWQQPTTDTLDYMEWQQPYRSYAAQQLGFQQPQPPCVRPEWCGLPQTYQFGYHPCHPPPNQPPDPLDWTMQPGYSEFDHLPPPPPQYTPNLEPNPSMAALVSQVERLTADVEQLLSRMDAKERCVNDPHAATSPTSHCRTAALLPAAAAVTSLNLPPPAPPCSPDNSGDKGELLDNDPLPPAVISQPGGPDTRPTSTPYHVVLAVVPSAIQMEISKDVKRDRSSSSLVKRIATEDFHNLDDISFNDGANSNHGKDTSFNSFCDSTLDADARLIPPRTNQFDMSGMEDIECNPTIHALRGLSDKRFVNAVDMERPTKTHCFGGVQEVGFLHEYRVGADWVFIDHPSYHQPGTQYGDIFVAFGDNLFRFILLCHAACEVLLVMPVRGYTNGEMDNFFLDQGTSLQLSFKQSTHEEVLEQAATAPAILVALVDDNANNIDTRWAEAVLRDAGISLLLYLARQWREGLQSEAAKAIAILVMFAEVAKVATEEGSISVTVTLARSNIKWVAQDPVRLGYLPVGEAYQGVIDGEQFKTVLEELSALLSSFAAGEFVWLCWIKFRMSGRVTRNIDEFLEFVVSKHLCDRGEGEKVFVHVLLDVPRNERGGFVLDHISIKALILDMFEAGYDTAWKLTKLIRHTKAKNEFFFHGGCPYTSSVMCKL